MEATTLLTEALALPKILNECSDDCLLVHPFLAKLNFYINWSVRDSHLRHVCHLAIILRHIPPNTLVQFFVY